jgi:pSer/pThr/pTyr-binding forkhead associated (FHA) protein
MKHPPVIVVQLIHIHGPMKGEIREYSEGLISIGRHPTCTLRFPADLTGISRKHAEIIRKGNQFKLVDLSVNGTFLNGKKVQEAFLKDGDVLEITEGGPKVSFLTKMAEVSIESGKNSAYLDEPGQTPAGEAPQEIRSGKAVLPEKPGIPVNESNNSVHQAGEGRFDLQSQKVNASLIIQYGPTIRTFKELPITIGKNSNCDFVLLHPAILGQHAQILFSRNQYWIKDLSGRNMIQINNRPIEFQAPLNPADEFSLAPQGPLFSYIGEGRLAEVITDSIESPLVATDEKEQTAKKNRALKRKSFKGFWSKIKDNL